MQHIMDDFLMITVQPVMAAKECKLIVDTCDYLGVPTVQDKTESGTTLVLLSIELDSLQLQARLSPHHIYKCVSKIQAVLSKETVKKIRIRITCEFSQLFCMFSGQTRQALHEEDL